ncbi:uncharacterized protein LOC128205396 [Mya arenaria]|uniref:uncharacterized protein LOC128205396 n=1 Tax=Mya arenaria TaxID=6604 RepID=UPI0022E54138|nr:uncharacterized protein LOC128205396 [Mya arenaria]
MASGIDNTDRNIPPEDLCKDFYENIVNIGHCYVEGEKCFRDDKNKSEDLYRKALVLTKKVSTCLEAKIGSLYLRETPGRRDPKDNGMKTVTSSVTSQPTDDTSETGYHLSGSHVLATSMSRASLPLD